MRLVLPHEKNLIGMTEMSKQILIIHGDRSGGRALMYSLSDKLGIPWWDNPFSPKPGQKGYDEIKEGKVWLERPNTPCILKTSLNEHIHYTNKLIHYNTKIILSISNWFTDIILLDRKDIDAQISSWEHSLLPEHPLYLECSCPTQCQPSPSGLYNTCPDKEKSKRFKNQFIEMKKSLVFLSGKLKIPIHYYEDIFGDKQYRKEHFGQKGLPYNDQWFHPSRRYKDGEPWWKLKPKSI
mgnify:FL=1